MALFGNKEAQEAFAKTVYLEAENKLLKEKIEWLQERLDASVKSVADMEQALISKYSPRAYEDLRADKYPEEPVSEEDKLGYRIQRDVATQFLESIERPLFDRNDPRAFSQELEDLLASAAGDIPSRPLDENNPES